MVHLSILLQHTLFLLLLSRKGVKEKCIFSYKL